MFTEPGEDPETVEAAIGANAYAAYKKNPEPTYPRAARRRGQEGTVLLTVRVSATGHALEVKVKQSSGFRSLDEAAVQAVEDWEFEPARVNTRRVESDVEVPVQFRLTD
jgi:protein TonB